MEKLEKIKSFLVDHTKLKEGIYVSRVDGDITTFDIRFIRPNVPPFLDNSALHTIEHLFATYVRNGNFSDKVIYFGPMGCRTGFYLLMRNIDYNDAIKLILESLKFISKFDGEIPGSNKEECGNYREHDLEKAKGYVLDMIKKVENWTKKDLEYI